MERIVNLHIEKLPEGFYLATSDSIQGLIAQGRTITETIEIAKDIAKKLIEAQEERNTTLTRDMNKDSSISTASASTSSDESVNSRQELKEAGYKAELLQSNVVLYIFMAIGGGIIPIVGPLYWFYLAFRNFFKKYTRFYHFTQKPVYVQDIIFKTGKRYVGSTNVKEYSVALAKPVKSERIVFVLKGLIALAIAICFASFQYASYVFWNTPIPTNTTTVALGIVQADHGLNGEHLLPDRLNY